MSPKRNYPDIREARLHAGLSQEQLAVRAGVTAKTLASLENGGAQNPRRATIQAIELALDAAMKEAA